MVEPGENCRTERVGSIGGWFLENGESSGQGGEGVWSACLHWEAYRAQRLGNCVAMHW